MHIFKIGSHYIRASSAQSARVRAFEVWGAQGYPQAIGNQAPDIGRHGYNQAVNADDIQARKIVAAPLRGFYDMTAATETRINAKALAIMAKLGLA